MEDTPMSKSLEYFLSTPHWLDATSGPLEEHVAKLAQTVRFLASIRTPANRVIEIPLPRGLKLKIPRPVP